MKQFECNLQQALARHTAEIDKRDGLWDAAVLVPLVYVGDEPCILFEVRSQSLKRQPGQICFPGGHFECKDGDFQTTAIRETCEELGVAAANIEIFGALDVLVAHAGPILHPYVGRLCEGTKLCISSDEVAETFTVPLKFLLEHKPRVGYIQLADRPREDFPLELVPGKASEWRRLKEYAVYFYIYEHRVIWGLTARILHGFLETYRSVLEEVGKC